MGKGNIPLRSFVNHFAFAADDNIQKEILSHITEGVCRPFKVSCFIDWENFSLPIEAHISAAARQRFLRSRKKFEAKSKLASERLARSVAPIISARPPANFSPLDARRAFLMRETRVLQR